MSWQSRLDNRFSPIWQLFAEHSDPETQPITRNRNRNRIGRNWNTIQKSSSIQQKHSSSIYNAKSILSCRWRENVFVQEKSTGSQIVCSSISEELVCDSSAKVWQSLTAMPLKWTLWKRGTWADGSPVSLLESIGKVLSNACQQLLASKSDWAYQEKDSKFCNLWQEHFVKHEY